MLDILRGVYGGENDTDISGTDSLLKGRRVTMLMTETLVSESPHVKQQAHLASRRLGLCYPNEQMKDRVHHRDLWLSKLLTGAHPKGETTVL